MAARSFTRAAVRLTRLLGEECAVVGGMAVNAHGYVRATHDIDVMVPFSLEEARRRLAEQRIETSMFRGDVLEGDFPCVKGVVGGVPFDVLPPLVPIARERFLLLALHGTLVPVVDFDTLARLKLRAGAPKDLLDLAMLANLEPTRRDRVLELAAYDRDLYDRLRVLIEHPRVKRDVAERQAEAKLLAKDARARAAKPKRR